MCEVLSMFGKMSSALQREKGILKLSTWHSITESNQGPKFKKSFPLEPKGNTG